jgi:predicted small metal-binding protein
MAIPVKLNFRPLDISEIAKHLGVSSSRASEISAIVDRSDSDEKKASYSFRCVDVGYEDCPWQTRGASEDEVMRNAEQHGREKHQIAVTDVRTRNKVRSNIRRAG